MIDQEKAAIVGLVCILGFAFFGCTTMNEGYMSYTLPMEEHSILIIPEELYLQTIENNPAPIGFNWNQKDVILIPSGSYSLTLGFFRNGGTGVSLTASNILLKNDFRAGRYYLFEHQISGNRISVSIKDITDSALAREQKLVQQISGKIGKIDDKQLPLSILTENTEPTPFEGTYQPRSAQDNLNEYTFAGNTFTLTRQLVDHSRSPSSAFTRIYRGRFTYTTDEITFYTLEYSDDGNDWNAHIGRTLSKQNYELGPTRLILKQNDMQTVYSKK
jgi:hypothetical protein